MTARRLRSALVAAATALVVAVTASPASAAIAGFGSASVVGQCLHAYSTTSAQGVTRGAMQCGAPDVDGEIVFFSGNGTTWTRIRTRTSGKVVGFAVDSVNWYAMYVQRDVDGLEQGPLRLLVRNRSTGTSRVTALAAQVDGLQVTSGSIVASGGRYWAVWSRTTETDRNGDVRTAQTLVPSLPRSMPVVRGSFPQLALRGTTSVDLVVQDTPQPTAGNPDPSGAVVRYRPTSAGGWSRLTVRRTNAFRPTIRVTGAGTTRLAWVEPVAGGRYTVVYQDDVTGSWVRTTLPGLAARRTRPFIALSGGRLTVAWDGVRADGTGRTALAQRADGVWSTASIGDGTSRAGDRGLLQGLGSWSGRLVVLLGVTEDPQVSGRLVARRQP